MAFQFDGSTVLSVQSTYLSPFRQGSTPKAGMGGWFYFPTKPTTLTHLMGATYTNSASMSLLGQATLVVNASGVLGFNIRGVFGTSDTGTFLTSGVTVTAGTWYFLSVRGDNTVLDDGSYVVSVGTLGGNDLAETTHTAVTGVAGTWPSSALSDFAVGGVKTVGTGNIEQAEVASGVEMMELWTRGDSTHTDAQPTQAQIASLYNGGYPVMGAPMRLPMPAILESGTDYRSLGYWPLHDNLRDHANSTSNISGRLTLSVNSGGTSTFIDRTSNYNISASAMRFCLIADMQIGNNNDAGATATDRNENTRARGQALVDNINAYSWDRVITLGDDIDSPDPADGEHDAEVAIYDTVWASIKGLKSRILGNHDADRTSHMSGAHAQKYIANFTETYGADLQIIYINSNPLKSQSDPTRNLYTSGDVTTILDYLEARLTEGTFTHRVVCLHTPPYRDDELTDADNSVWKMGNDETNTPVKSKAWHKGTTNIAVRETLLALMRDNGVELCFVGHVHTNEHISAGGLTFAAVSSTSWINNSTWWGTTDYSYNVMIVDGANIHERSYLHTDTPVGVEPKVLLEQVDLDAIGNAVWSQLASLLTVSGSVGKLVADNLDAAVTSRSSFDPATATVDVGKISGDATAADNLEAVLDGTGADIKFNTLTGDKVAISNATPGEAAVNLNGFGTGGIGLLLQAGGTGGVALQVNDASDIGVGGGTSALTGISDAAAAGVLATPANKLATDSAGTVDLSAVDGITDDKLRELRLSSLAGKTTLTDNGDGTKTLRFFKQDGTTPIVDITFNTSTGEWNTTAIDPSP